MGESVTGFGPKEVLDPLNSSRHYWLFKKNFRRPEGQVLPLTLQQSTKRRKYITYKNIFLLCLNIVTAYIKNFYVVTFTIFCHFMF